MLCLQNAVKDLIMERFDRANNNPSSAASANAATPSPTPQTNGHSGVHGNSISSPKKEIQAESKVKSATPASSTPGGDYGDDSDVVSPPKKKRKQNGGSKEVDDATLAAILQAQENRFVAPPSPRLPSVSVTGGLFLNSLYTVDCYLYISYLASNVYAVWRDQLGEGL
jgi:hypothetical protein